MTSRPLSVLVLCTGNSARSILAEALLNNLGGDRIRAHSAGSQPKGQVHPAALALLAERGFDTGSYRSKSWDEFDDSSFDGRLDVVFTVCDSAAAETCPVWPGHPMTVHWGIPDPAAITTPGEEQRRAFETAYDQLKHRIEAFLAIDDLDPEQDSLKAQLEVIGRL